MWLPIWPNIGSQLGGAASRPLVQRELSVELRTGDFSEK